jgi:hypothetical protein
MKKRYSDEQIIGFLKEADSGMPVKELLAETMLENDAVKEALQKKW